MYISVSSFTFNVPQWMSWNYLRCYRCTINGLRRYYTILDEYFTLHWSNSLLFSPHLLGVGSFSWSLQMFSWIWRALRGKLASWIARRVPSVSGRTISSCNYASRIRVSLGNMYYCTVLRAGRLLSLKTKNRFGQGALKVLGVFCFPAKLCYAGAMLRYEWHVLFLGLSL